MSLELKKYDDRLARVFLIKGIGLSSNVYAIGEEEVTLIDTGVGNSFNRISPQLENLKLDAKNINQIILTHGHFDHTGGLAELLRLVSPTILIHLADAKSLENLSKHSLKRLKDRDIIAVEGRQLRVIHSPGHTIGSICLYDSEDKILFSGDTVFAGGSFGRCDLTTGDIDAMVKTLRRLSKLNVDFLLPGHGGPVIGDANVHIRLAFEAARAFSTGED